MYTWEQQQKKQNIELNQIDSIEKHIWKLFSLLIIFLKIKIIRCSKRRTKISAHPFLGPEKRRKYNWKGGTEWRQLEQTKISKKNNEEAKRKSKERVEECGSKLIFNRFLWTFERKKYSSMSADVRTNNSAGIIRVSGRLG